jgi:predicted RNase H-like HicB family nuclease
MRYIAILETNGDGWNAYVPDLPGCVAAGDTCDEVAVLIKEAVALHIMSLREHGEPIPTPSAVGTIDVDAA